MSSIEKKPKARSDSEDIVESEKKSDQLIPPNDKKDIRDLLKSSKRRGLASKGQQGIIDFDLPRKK